MTLGPNADERNLLAELKAAIHDDGENGEPVDRLGAGPMTAATWGCCPAPRRLWRAADLRRRVPRARRPRRGRRVRRTTRRRAGAGPAR